MDQKGIIEYCYFMIPLAEKIRPKTLAEVAGQEHLIGPNAPLTRIVSSGRPHSILLFGPPGCGKTTLARLYASHFNARFVPFSAVFNGVADFKKIIKEKEERPLFDQQLILFVDEIHRFNKAQQDAFLPFIEDGTMILVGATTENPSFSLNNALLSRLRVFTVNALEETALEHILTRYETLIKKLPLTEKARLALIGSSQGDARHLLNMVESLQDLSSDALIDAPELLQLIQKKRPLYDKAGEGHYNLISALHKAVRGSDPDAALYWLARMLQGGEDPQFVARRIVRMASEDIGLADPEALTVTVNAWKSFDQLGSPEGDLALAEAVVYLALAPKSNALYTAFKRAQAAALETSHLNPPKIILNAPTNLMKQMGYGKDYIYDPDTTDGFSGQNYFPDEMERIHFYRPVERGFEREMKKRLIFFSNLRAKKNLPDE
ncbi:MAG: replication-associated recombination protein A [Chlamydiota bacterium]